MNQKFVVFVFVLILPILAVSGPAVAAEGDFIVDGGGWGHGVGMSQYGAQGMALEGSSADEIIGYYYSGAQLKPAQSLGTLPGWLFEDEALAVNVASNRDILDFWVTSGSVEVCHNGDETNTCPDVTVTAGQHLIVTVANEDGSRCNRSVVDGNGQPVGGEIEGDCWFDISWDDVFLPSIPSTLVSVEELRYARGPFQIRPNTLEPTFDVVVRLGLEEYLYGIAEVFLNWESAALQAQAVAARSYAVSVAAARGGADGSGLLDECGCHLRRTPADQNYDAYLGASEGVARWRQAVDVTWDKVVTHPEVGGGTKIVTTYYSSSTGGATENVEDVFGGDPQPHLKSRDDPWSLKPEINNPFTTWSALVTKGAAAGWLGWDEVRSMQLVSGPPGSLIRFQGVDAGAEVSVDKLGWSVRQAFGLRSPYISGIAREGPPPPPFTDIETSVHYFDIGTIWRAGLTKGCNPPANTLYCPEQAVTRQQMASFIVRALDLAPAPDDAFVDDDGSIHQGDINSLAAAGITKGCNPPANDRFCPEQAVTRGQMAAFLVRAYGYTDPGPGNLFIDDDGSVFAADIDRLATAGITKGCNPPANDRYCPNDPVTREQMASFLARAMTG
ncbi:MAG: SpoIID/LytB domain-containing protein [Acidimicrobiia bacterium]